MTFSTLSRRERLRAATIDEIKTTARRLLVQDGLPAVSLRAIGREIGMTGPALYRYFAGLADLIAALGADLYDECREHLEAARDACGSDDPGTRMYAVSRAFRAWSVAHPAEFGLIFAAPIGVAVEADPATPQPNAAGRRFVGVFAALFIEIWRTRPFPVPDGAGVAIGLGDLLWTHLGAPDAELPRGAAQLFLSCWIRLYGMVCMEVFGHLRFAVEDAEPVFEAELAAIAQQLGLPPQ